MALRPQPNLVVGRSAEAAAAACDLAYTPLLPLANSRPPPPTTSTQQPPLRSLPALPSRLHASCFIYESDHEMQRQQQQQHGISRRQVKILLALF